MKKIMSIAINVFLISCIIFVSFFNFPTVHAKTVNDLKSELNSLEANAKENKDKLKYTEAQINAAKKDITQINIDMVNISQEIIDKNKEIGDLNTEIKGKDKETKDLMEFIQLSNGYSFYLEYIMGSESLTDFIYRLSVTEQLTEYNSKLITEMNGMIKANEARKEELNNKTKELEQKQVQLAVNLKILANQKIRLDEYDRSIEDEIANARDVIQMYINAGCKGNENINVCGDIPVDTKFTRPFIKGVVTSEYGPRRYYINGAWKSDNHHAIDIANSGTTTIYSVASGKVAKIFYDSAGGNQVVVHHRIMSNGKVKNYSSTYCHLAYALVGNGQVVSRDTKIGIMGSTGSATGPHVHLAISNGLRYIEYVSYNDYIAHSFNPRNVINFPSKGTYWYNRTTNY